MKDFHELARQLNSLSFTESQKLASILSDEHNRAFTLSFPSSAQKQEFLDVEKTFQQLRDDLENTEETDRLFQKVSGVKYTIFLKDPGLNKLQVVKELKILLNISLKEAKDLLDSSPCLVKSNMTEEEAEFFKKDLKAVGAKVHMLTDEKFSQLEKFKDLVIGEVVECKNHPSLESTIIAIVNIGEESLQIISGQRNVTCGLKVIVARAGTIIHPTHDYKQSILVKKGKYRGEESNGIICRQDEIGLGDFNGGIMILKADAPIGMSLMDYFIELDGKI